MHTPSRPPAAGTAAPAHAPGSSHAVIDKAHARSQAYGVPLREPPGYTGHLPTARLAQALVERDAQRFNITILGDEPCQAYNRIQLSPVLGAEKAASETRLLPEAWYPQHHVTVRTGESVTAVDMAARTLQTTVGELRWDELVFATGSLPFLPPPCPRPVQTGWQWWALPSAACSCWPPS